MNTRLRKSRLDILLLHPFSISFPNMENHAMAYPPAASIAMPRF
jgi:hypothetical protein